MLSGSIPISITFVQIARPKLTHEIVRLWQPTSVARVRDAILTLGIVLREPGRNVPVRAATGTASNAITTGLDHH